MTCTRRLCIKKRFCSKRAATLCLLMQCAPERHGIAAPLNRHCYSTNNKSDVCSHPRLFQADERLGRICEGGGEAPIAEPEAVNVRVLLRSRHHGLSRARNPGFSRREKRGPMRWAARGAAALHASGLLHSRSVWRVRFRLAFLCGCFELSWGRLKAEQAAWNAVRLVVRSHLVVRGHFYIHVQQQNPRRVMPACGRLHRSFYYTFEA